MTRAQVAEVIGDAAEAAAQELIDGYLAGQTHQFLDAPVPPLGGARPLVSADVSSVRGW